MRHHKDLAKPSRVSLGMFGQYRCMGSIVRSALWVGMGPSVLQKPVLDVLSEKATAVLTNVPGPQQPLYLAGSPLRELMFWVPQNGSIGMGISILSYNGQVFFGLITDRKLVPEPQRVIDRFRAEFEKLLYLGMMLPLEGRPEEALAQQVLSAPDSK